jgi:hypothetical protein
MPPSSAPTSPGARRPRTPPAGTNSGGGRSRRGRRPPAPSAGGTCPTSTTAGSRPASGWTAAGTSSPTGSGALDHAPIRVAHLTDVGDDEAAWLARLPDLAKLCGLGCTVYPLSALARLLASPHLGGLELLHLDLSGTGGDPARFLAACPGLSRLTVLSLADTPLGADGLAVLAGAAHLSGLRKLCVCGDDVGAEVSETGVRALTRSRTLTGLTHLSFRMTTLAGPALRHLLRWPAVGRLRELDLAYTDLRGDDVAALGRCARLTSLRRLALDAYELDDAAAAALGSAPWLPAVREVWIEAADAYGDAAGQTPGALDELKRRLGPKLVLPDGGAGSGFELGAVGEADRIWHRLQRFHTASQYRDEGRSVAARVV